MEQLGPLDRETDGVFGPLEGGLLWAERRTGSPIGSSLGRMHFPPLPAGLGKGR